MIKNKSKLVRETCKYVIQHSSGHTTINQSKIQLVHDIQFQNYIFIAGSEEQLEPEQNLKYIFILIGMTYCFWPKLGMEYKMLPDTLLAVKNGFLTVDKMCKMTKQYLSQYVFKQNDIPLIQERALAIRQIGIVVNNQFQGKFSNIINSANKSAVKLLQILTNKLIIFQDHGIYKGHQIHFYKLAQLLIANVWRSFKKIDLGEFYDIHELTIFPDYRVPQILRHWGVIEYSKELAQKVDNYRQIQSGSEQQIEIRASIVIAAQKIKDHLNKKYNKQYISVEIDQYLWQTGQRLLNQIKPNHRTLTIYY